MIRSSILALLLTFSAFASSPEYLVGDAVPTAASRYRALPSVASDGEDFFAVWADDRSGSGSVIGTRITSDGRVLDPLGIRIDTSPWIAYPQVVWDGAAYLVVWSTSQLDGGNSIKAARIAPDGSFVMQPRVLLTDASAERGSLASNGIVSVLAYHTDRAVPALRALVLDGDGNPVHDESISSAWVYHSAPVVAAGIGRFVVAWQETAPGAGKELIKALPIDMQGVALSPTRIILTEGVRPAIASDGTRFTVTWTGGTLVNPVLSSRTYDGDLVPVEKEYDHVTGIQLLRPSLLWIGDHYELTTMRLLEEGRSEIVSIELDRDGRPRPRKRSRGEVPEYPVWQELASATNGADVLAVRSVDGPPQVGRQMFAQLYAGNADASSALALLSWSGNAHREPGIASSPSGHFAAWVEQDGVFATRIDRNGNSLDGRGIRLSGHHASSVHTAFDGTNYVVVWRDTGFLRVRWIAPLTGATVAGTQLAVDDHLYFPPELALAVSPDATYVVYTDYGVHVMRIPHSTHTPDAVPLEVTDDEMFGASPAVAWNGSTLLVTWTEMHGDPRGPAPPLLYPVAIRAARVSAGLALLDPAPLLVTEVDPGDDTIGPSSVASNGTDWLVVASPYYGEDVLARRVLSNGTVEGNAPVKIGDGTDPVVAWTGARYAVAWKETTVRVYERELVMAAVPRSGALVAIHREVVSDAVAFSRPSIVAAGGGEAAVAYTKFSHLPGHAGVERTFFRVMDLNPRGRVVRR